MQKTTVGSSTERGANPKRTVNEDFYQVVEPLSTDPRSSRGRLYVVADGVGGAAAGEIASRLAVSTTIDYYYKSTWLGPEQTLRTAVQTANRAVFDRAQANPSEAGMTSSATALVVLGDQGYVAQVGDGRCYSLRNGKLTQITLDHSLVAEQVRKGLITPEQAKVSTNRNVVTRSLGLEPGVEVDLFKLTLVAGDTFILVTDGLHGVLGDEGMKAFVASAPPTQAAPQMIAAVRTRRGQDDATVVVVRFDDVGPASFHGRGAWGSGKRIAAMVGAPILLAAVLALVFTRPAPVKDPAQKAKEYIATARIGLEYARGSGVDSLQLAVAYAALHDAEVANSAHDYEGARAFARKCLDLESGAVSPDRSFADKLEAVNKLLDSALGLKLNKAYDKADDLRRQALGAKGSGQMERANKLLVQATGVLEPALKKLGQRVGSEDRRPGIGKKPEEKKLEEKKPEEKKPEEKKLEEKKPEEKKSNGLGDEEQLPGD
jgi:serine/threonine protein phosphatase PrpC